jgi:hypothetical protein
LYWVVQVALFLLAVDGPGAIGFVVSSYKGIPFSVRMSDTATYNAEYVSHIVLIERVQTPKNMRYTTPFINNAK